MILRAQPIKLNRCSSMYRTDTMMNNYHALYSTSSSSSASNSDDDYEHSESEDYADQMITSELVSQVITTSTGYRLRRLLKTLLARVDMYHIWLLRYEHASNQHVRRYYERLHKSMCSDGSIQYISIGCNVMMIRVEDRDMGLRVYIRRAGPTWMKYDSLPSDESNVTSCMRCLRVLYRHTGEWSRYVSAGNGTCISYTCIWRMFRGMILYRTNVSANRDRHLRLCDGCSLSPITHNGLCERCVNHVYKYIHLHWCITHIISLPELSTVVFRMYICVHRQAHNAT